MKNSKQDGKIGAEAWETRASARPPGLLLVSVVLMPPRCLNALQAVRLKSRCFRWKLSSKESSVPIHNVGESLGEVLTLSLSARLVESLLLDMR